jgi:gas vesicle protein
MPIVIFAIGGIVGAVLTYIFDPRNGNRRRALIRDQFRSRTNKLENEAESKGRHIRNRVRGFVAQARERFANR